MSLAWFQRCVVLLCIAFPLVAAGADDYAIQFDRPKKVGDRYQIAAKGSRKRSSLSWADDKMQPEQRESLEAELTAEVEVIAISPKGAAQKIRLSGTQITFFSQGRQIDVFPNGMGVTVELVGGKSQYSVGGSPASEAISKAFELVIRLSPDEPSDDVVFGTDQRQKVGDRWQMNAGAAAASLEPLVGSKISPRDVSGGCEIKEVVTTEGGPTLRIEGEVVIANVKPPLPESFTVRKSRVLAKLSGLLPVDVRKGALQQSSTVDVEIEAEGERDGVKLRITSVGVETKEVRYTYR